MNQRLKDQLKVHKRALAIHANPRLLEEIAFYPAHDARRETPEYKQVHKKLVHELDLPCFICGVKNSTLKDKNENRYGAKALETHHHIIEWTLAGAISAEKFSKQLLPHLRHRHAN